AERPDDGRIASIVREGLAKIGVTADIQVAATSLEAKSMEIDGDFDASLGRAAPGVDPERDRILFETGGRKNRGHYSNPKVDALFDRGGRLFKRPEREACYREIHSLIYDDQPSTFLYHRQSLWAISKRLRGVALSVRGPYLFDPGVRNWWVAADPDAWDSANSD
ncbi:MAG: hypothetical protein O7D94_06500, partial [Planctomycetota bacterium]|nr:hypothetical protein [Planctomycetota bacterium]